MLFALMGLCAMMERTNTIMVQARTCTIVMHIGTLAEKSETGPHVLAHAPLLAAHRRGYVARLATQHSIQFSSVYFTSLHRTSVFSQFGSVQFSVQVSSFQFSSVQFSSVQFSSVTGAPVSPELNFENNDRRKKIIERT